MGRPIPPGRGAVLGEVRDCAGSPVANAVFGTDADAAALIYFTGVDDGPLPDLSASATGPSGRFGALDVAAGPIRVVAAAQIDGVVTSLGHRDVRVFPEAITWVELSGPLPTQRPAD